MNAKITVKRIGNHWYPCINHDFPEDIFLDEKIEKVFSLADKENYEIITVYFYEQFEVLGTGTLQFDETDMIRYLTTNDEFLVSFYIDDHRFQISSNLLALLEVNYNFNFQDSFYRVDFW